MKRILFAGALALAAASPALAADLPQAPPPPPPQAPAAYVPTVVPQYNWGGIYFGLNGGYGFGDSSWNTPGGSTGDFSTDGGLVGVTVGANFQTGPLVVGIEGDIDWSDIKGNLTSTALCGGGATCTFQTENDWLGTIRGRVGYAWDRVLFYGTAGGAFGNIKPQLTVVSAGGTTAVQSDSSEFGWTAGAGVEVALAENWTARVEYLFVDLQNGTLSCAATTCGTAISAPVSFETSLVRAGLNFKFNAF
jgi:outer membrane immunogenic protein